MTAAPTGPLAGLRVVEMAAMGPVPFCGMLLSDLGADVVRVDRPSPRGADDPLVFTEVLARGRRSVTADLKTPDGVAAVLDLIDRADVVLEGLRPGVMERLGLGPEPCTTRNPALVYGRMTGYGQDGPLARAPGHDINYLALTGALHAIGTADSGPVAPLNLVADFGGGGMLLAFGVVAAAFEARSSGRGQVVDAAMVDGAALLATSVFELLGRGLWTDRRAENIFDGGAPFYTTYRTADDGWMAVGAVEPQFYADLLARLEIDPRDAPQWDRARWPALRERFARVFTTRTRDDWTALFDGTDSCCTPVLSLQEAPNHLHNTARQTFIQLDGVTQPAPAPRFGRTPARATAGSHTDTAQLLAEWRDDRPQPRG